MSSRSVNFLKIIISLIFIIIGINFIVQGNLILKKNEHRIEKKNLSNKEIIVKEKNTKLKKEKKILDKNINIKENFKEKIIIVKKNDTFHKIIDNFIDNNNIKKLIINELSKEYNLKKLKIGQKIYFYENDENNIVRIIVPIDFSTDIILEIVSNRVKVIKEKINISKEINSKKFTILSSLYEDGIKEGIPLSILINIIRLYSFDIDFQRDIKKYTKLEVSYETFFNSKRNNTSYGNIKYVNLIINNKDLEYFFFQTNEGFNDYFDREGKNVKKSLLKTPIDGARLSSSFGMRKHPILGYNKLHKGLDFAAKKGTPVFAGGNGIIEYAGKNAGYGKYILIRHNNEYKTAYAHLSAYKNGIAKGKRVNQGDIIGYVGSTGNSTGPHLHYEIIFQGKQINPMKMKLPSSKILKSNELDRFKKNVNDIYSKHLFSLYE